MAFQQLAGVALPYEQRLHFRCVSWRAKSFAWQLTKRKCSLCSQSRVAFAITRFITFQRLRFYNLLAYRDLVFLTLLPRQENRLFSVSRGSVFLKMTLTLLAIRSLNRRWSGDFPNFPRTEGLPHFREASSFPGPWLGRALADPICHFTASAVLFVLCSKVDLPRNFGTLHKIYHCNSHRFSSWS